MSKRTYLAVLAITALVALAPPRAEAVPTISVGGILTTPPSYIPALPAGAFLVEIDISGAFDLQSWQFDLLFNNTVVEEVDPGDGSSGIYGAEFTSGDPTTASFILGGFPFNAFGEVDGVAGSYPSLLTGPTGSGPLAFIVFDFLSGQEGNDPGFSIANPVISQPEPAPIPEPATLLLLAGGLGLLHLCRRPKRA